MYTSRIPNLNDGSGIHTIAGILPPKAFPGMPGFFVPHVLPFNGPAFLPEGSRMLPKHTTYYLLMFFKLKILIILCRPQKVFFGMYVPDNQTNIINTPTMNLYSKVMFYVGIGVIAMFFLFGLFILISPVFSYIPQNYRIFISIFMMGYGVFRLIQMVQKLRKSKEEDL